MTKRGLSLPLLLFLLLSACTSPQPTGRIAFSSDRDGDWDIYVMNADGSGQIKLSNNESTDRSPACSPDGTRIAFSSARHGNLEIYVMSADGSGLTRDEKAAWALSLLTSHARRLLVTVGRVYPDGLVKYEPGDLLDLPVLVPPKFHGVRVWYRDTVAALLSGEVEKAKQMADHWFGLM